MRIPREISTSPGASRRGSVLLIVLITVALLSLLVVTLVGLETSMEISVVAAKELAQQEYTATGGLEIACALLEQDKTDTENDNLFEAWAQPRRCKICDYNCEIVIVDEQSKINMNGLALEDEVTIKRMVRLLIMIDPELKINVAEKKVVEACAAMAQEWAIKQRFVNSFEQLMTFPPFTEEIVLGKKDANGRTIRPGLVEYITFQTASYVNINTAPREVLLAILGFENEELVDRIIEFRETADDDGNRYGFTDFTKLNKDAADRDSDDYGEDDILYHADSIALISQNFIVASGIFEITVVSPTRSISADTSAAPALPARGWIWLVTRANSGKINTVRLREATQTAKYLKLESEK